MTEAERLELEALEAAPEPRDYDRLHFLRLRAAGVATWDEVLDAYRAALDEPMPESLEYPAWMRKRSGLTGPES